MAKAVYVETIFMKYEMWAAYVLCENKVASL